MGNFIMGDRLYDDIVEFDGFTITELLRFNSPSSNISGTSFDDSGNIWSCDNGTGRIYKHVLKTSTIDSNFLAPGTTIFGITVDHDTLYSIDITDNEITIHVGKTASVASQFASPASIASGITIHNGDLYTTDQGAIKAYKHAGVTSSVDVTISLGKAPRGCTFDDLDFYYTETISNTCRQQIEFSSTERSNFTPSPVGDPVGGAWTDFDARVGAGGNGQNALFWCNF